MYSARNARTEWCGWETEQNTHWKGKFNADRCYINLGWSPIYSCIFEVSKTIKKILLVFAKEAKKVDYLHIFRCDPYVHIPSDERSKLSSKPRNPFSCHSGGKGYLQYDPQWIYDQDASPSLNKPLSLFCSLHAALLAYCFISYLALLSSSAWVWQ